MGVRLERGCQVISWKPVAVLAVAAGLVLLGDWYGSKRVQQAWDKENTRVANALVVQALAIRDKEQTLQDAMNEVQADAAKQIEQLRADAAGVDAAAGRLRERVNTLLTASKTASTCTSGNATTNPGDLLAVVLDKSIQRNRQLAEYADTLRVAATSCVASYEKARN